jgi:hypothetical protein
MLFAGPTPNEVVSADKVHARILLAFGGLEIEGWRYEGYRVAVQDRDQYLVLRFEKGLIDRLAAAEVRIKAATFNEIAFPVAAYMADRLSRVEARLVEARHQELARN